MHGSLAPHISLNSTHKPLIVRRSARLSTTAPGPMRESALQSFWAKKFFYYGELLVSEKFLSNGFPLWFYSLRRVSGLFWAKSIITFFFKFIHWFQICLTRIVQKLGVNQGTFLQKEEGKNEERKKIKESKNLL